MNGVGVLAGNRPMSTEWHSLSIQNACTRKVIFCLMEYTVKPAAGLRWMMNQFFYGPVKFGLVNWSFAMFYWGHKTCKQYTLTDSEIAHNNEQRPSGLNLAEKSQSQPWPFYLLGLFHRWSVTFQSVPSEWLSIRWLRFASRVSLM
jgi:hypothetical protein